MTTAATLSGLAAADWRAHAGALVAAVSPATTILQEEPLAAKTTMRVGGGALSAVCFFDSKGGPMRPALFLAGLKEGRSAAAALCADPL